MQLALCINPGIIFIHTNPWHSLGKATVIFTIPLHWCSSVIPGMNLDNTKCIFFRKTFLLQNFIMVQTFYITKLTDVSEIGICHTNLFTLVNIWSTAKSMNDGRKHFSWLFPVFSFITKSGNRTRLIVIAPEHCIPSMILGHSNLPAKENIFQFLEICWYKHPFFIPHKVNL